MSSGPKPRRNPAFIPLVDLQRTSLNEAAASGSMDNDTPAKHVTHDLNTAGLNWSKFDLSILRAYRQSYRLNTPSAFTSAANERILTRAGGIGRSSPTMVRRRRDADGAGGGGSGSWAARRVSKDHLVLAVRKDFNAAMIHEPEVITSFVYAVHNQDKVFRMRFAPVVPK